MVACPANNSADSQAAKQGRPHVTSVSFTALCVFASSRLIRAQFHREGAKRAKGIVKVYSLRLGFSVHFVSPW